MSSVSPLDLAVIAALVIAGLLGLWLGVVRVLLGIGSWIGAALLTVYGLPLLRPTARGGSRAPFSPIWLPAAPSFSRGW